MKAINQAWACGIVVGLFLTSVPCVAQYLAVGPEVPNVKIERYQGEDTVMWRGPAYGDDKWPGSSCPLIRLPATASDASRRLMFQAVFTAKLANARMTIWYDPVACTVYSYSLETP